ncbi:hypothetical protein LRY58_04510 [Candidatus Woesebacteria bacterium]|nr:hypothetical protein [Candidatus Woesebacteria bacterium]
MRGSESIKELFSDQVKSREEVKQVIEGRDVSMLLSIIGNWMQDLRVEDANKVSEFFGWLSLVTKMLADYLVPDEVEGFANWEKAKAQYNRNNKFSDFLR